jgi:hypothetical protein
MYKVHPVPGTAQAPQYASVPRIAAEGAFARAEGGGEKDIHDG